MGPLPDLPGGCTHGSFDDSRGSRDVPWTLGAARDSPVKARKAKDNMELASLGLGRDGFDGCPASPGHPLAMRRGSWRWQSSLWTGTGRSGFWKRYG